MSKKIYLVTLCCLLVLSCEAFSEDDFKVPVQTQIYQAPKVKKPSSVIVCRNKQCAPAKLSSSKEFIYNTLLHILDINARKKALVCEGNANTHSCIEEYLSLPITVGITPAYMYIDDVKITDVSINQRNSSALDLVLNWNVSYNGQIPTCRPSKTILHVKDVNNVLLEDNGYTCKMTTVGVSQIKTSFAIDYIDLDYGYIGGFYSIGMSGPAFGGGAGYMILRLSEEMYVEPTNVEGVESENNFVANPKATLQNVNSIISYNSPASDYDKAKKELEKKRLQEKEDYEKWKASQDVAIDYNGVKVMPLPKKSSQANQNDDKLLNNSNENNNNTDGKETTTKNTKAIVVDKDTLKNSLDKTISNK